MKRVVLVLSTMLVAGTATALPAQVPADAPQDTSELARAALSRIKGAEDAPVTIVEVSDFQCPFCRTFAEETLPQIDSAYVQTGKVRFIFHNFPIPSHPRAWAASEAALCAGAQDAFWPMHDRLFAQQQAWGKASDAGAEFARYAAELGLDVADFSACTATDLVAPLLVGDLLQIGQAGIRGTPTFILNGENALSGALSFEELSAEIEKLLREQGTGDRE